MPGPYTSSGHGSERRPGALLHWVLVSAPPASGAVVMATGVLSIDFHLMDRETLSRVLLGLAAAAWGGLASLLALRLSFAPARVRREAREVGGLTAIAATGVLGTRLELAGWTAAALVFWAIAAAVWVVLMPIVARDWPRATTGSHFLVTVGSQGVAILAGVLAWRHGVTWLVPVGLAFLCLGLVLYAVVLARFSPRELVVGRGDHWIAGGGLVISALATATLVEAVRATGTLAGLEGGLGVLDLTLWSLSIAWLVPLVVCECARPRLRYDAARWATVFPLGMYAGMSILTGAVEDVAAFRELGRWLAWIALATWCLAALGLIRRAWELPGGRTGVELDTRSAPGH